MREELLKFIRMKTPNQTVLDVIDLKEKDVEDSEDEQFIAHEHYVVTCKVRYINPASPTGFLDSKEKKCLVDIEEFKRFLKSEKAVKWLDDEV